MSMALDRKYPTGKLRRARITTLLTDGIAMMLRSGTACRVRQVVIGRAGGSEELRVAGGAERAESDWRSTAPDSPWKGKRECRMSSAGRRSLAGRDIITFGTTGQRFFACGLGPRTSGIKLGCLRQLGGLPGVRIGRGRGHHPRQWTGPARSNPGLGQVRHPRRRGPDVHVRSKGRQRLYPGQRRRKAADQRRGKTAGWSSMARAGLPGRIDHGRRSSERRGLCGPERIGIRCRR